MTNLDGFTLAERKRREELADIPSDAFKSNDACMGYAETLDMSLLPAETKFGLGAIDVVWDAVINDEVIVFDKASNVPVLNTFYKVGVGKMFTNGQFRLQHWQRRGGGDIVRGAIKSSPSVHVLNGFVDGVDCRVSTHLQYIKTHEEAMEFIRGYAMSASRDPAMSGKRLPRDRNPIVFIASNTVRLQSLYKNREEQTFLGLPKGTRLPTKGGRHCFEVIARRGDRSFRTNGGGGMKLVIKGVDAASTQMILDHALTKGDAFVADPSLYGDDAYYVNGNLMFKHRRLQIDLANVVVPFISPLSKANYNPSTDCYKIDEGSIFNAITCSVPYGNGVMSSTGMSSTGLNLILDKGVLDSKVDDWMFS